MWVFVRGPVFISIFVRVLYSFDVHVFTFRVYSSIDKSFENKREELEAILLKRSGERRGGGGVGLGGFILLSVFFALYLSARSKIHTI